jgi:GT2 family glycosyltransferase
MPSDADVARVLVAVLVYNGREFVPRCLDSVTRLSKGASEVDVVVLDDHSPDEGWSDELGELAGSLSLDYYCSPRNLGIPRNFNLGLLRGLSAGYDYVLLLNSDVVVPYNLVDNMVAAAEAGGRVGSVTAWSNNCSIYGLPNDDGEKFLSSTDDVDWISEVLATGAEPPDVVIPVGVGFCLLVPVTAIREVGLFDPVFGRGYCEENDWCLRAKAAGLDNILATNVFVYHMGGGSTTDAGLLAPGETTVHAHERIIDWRYPTYRSDLIDFDRSGVLPTLREEGLARIVRNAACQRGYDVRLSSLPEASSAEREVHFVLRPEGRGQVVTGHYRGFTARFEIDPARGVIENLVGLAGRPPTRAAIFSRGPEASALAAEAARLGLPVALKNPYPERI